MKIEINSYWLCNIYEIISHENVSVSTLLLTRCWIFKIKHNHENQSVKYKAQWVIYSYKQWEGIDYTETFISVVHTNSWRLVLILCILHNFSIHHYNVVTVFLNIMFDESLYIIYLMRFEVKNQVLKLLKTLYNLKQLLHVWYTCLHKHLEAVKLIVSFYNLSIFINESVTVNIIITVYVDNLLICSCSLKQINNVLKHLQIEF